jgi:hypothetical protein
MKKYITLAIVALGLAVTSAQAVQLHQFNLNGPGGWGDANLSGYVNTYLQTFDPDKSFTYLGRVGTTGYGNFTFVNDTGEVSVDVNGLGSPTGEWKYENTNGPELDVVAFVLKGGREGGWLVYNDDLVPFVGGQTYDWAMPSQQGLSFFAAFGDPPRSVPEPGSTLVASLIGLLGLYGLRRRVS